MTGKRGWLTLHEVLEATDLPYRKLMELAERGLIATQHSGAAILYDPEDVALVARATQLPGHGARSSLRPATATGAEP